MEARVVAQEHLAHAAASEALHDDVGTDARAGLEIRELVDLVVNVGRRLEESGILVVRAQHGVDFLAQDRIGTPLAHVGGALPRRPLQRVRDDVLGHLPRRGIADAHGYPDVMRRRSHSLAVVQSRFTVATEIFITSAISSTVSPAKYRISTISACRGSSAASADRASCSISTST